MVADRAIGWTADRYNEGVRAFARLAALALLATAAAAAATACTFLVQFHDESGGSCEAGSCAGDDGTVSDDVVVAHDSGAGADGGQDAGPDVQADVKPAEGGADHYAPCADLANGEYCATDGLHGYAGPSSNLVTCADGGIGKVTSCDGGCLPLPAPFPDACNPCPGQPDGYYCGRNLPGFPAENADFLIQCQSGNVVQSVACEHGCDSNSSPPACYSQ